MGEIRQLDRGQGQYPQVAPVIRNQQLPYTEGGGGISELLSQLPARDRTPQRSRRGGEPALSRSPRVLGPKPTPLRRAPLPR